MTKELFEKGKELENRIVQLNLLKSFLRHALIDGGAPVNIHLNVVVSSFTSSNTDKIYPLMNCPFTTKKAFNQDDAEALFVAIDKQIQDIETQFDNLA